MSKYREAFPQFGRLEGISSTYISDRAIQYAEWYDRKAVKAKRNYIYSRVFIAISAVLVPFFSSRSLEIVLLGHKFDLALWATSVLSLSIAGLVALEGVLKFQEQWKNYRTTEQYIVTQIFMFGYGVEEYEKESEQRGFKIFVRNIESSIKNENEVTLNVLTRVSGSEQAPSPISRENLS